MASAPDRSRRVQRARSAGSRPAGGSSRQLPHSAEAEHAVLGGILLDPERLATIARLLKLEDFYLDRSQVLYSAMLALREAGKPVDRLTLQAKLDHQGDFERIGGLAYLACLDGDLPDLSGLENYAAIVRERSQLRRIILAAEATIGECRDGAGEERTALEILDRHSSALDRIRLDGLANAAPVPLAIPVGELLAMTLPPRRWIAAGLIQDRDVVMVHSWRGVGKTLFIYGLAYAVASGTTFLRHHVSSPMPVLVCDGEMPREDIQRRFAAIVEGAEVQLRAPLLLLSSDMLADGQRLPSLTTPEGQRILELNLARLGDGPRVLILDSLSTLCQSETPENDAASWDEMQAWLLKLRRQGVTSLFCHHDSKTLSQRGTSKREDILSQSVQLLRPRDYTPDQGARFEIHFTKARGVHGADAEPYEAWLTADVQGRQQWTVRDLGAIKAERARELAQAGLSVRDIGKELGVGKSTVQRWLAKAEE
jgi:KaiC/GvpD/RAD55 family RecA-like ATPase